MAKVIGVECQKRGKVGNKIMQVINGMQIEKTMAIPSNPESPGQVAQRGVFAEIIAGFKSIASNVISFFWAPTVVGNQTPWGNFISKNLLSMGKVAFDITKAVLSFGTLEPVSNLEATYDTATGIVAGTFDGDRFINGADADLFHVIVFDATSGSVIGKFLDEDARSEESLSVTCPTGLTATDIEVFLSLTQNSIASGDIGLVSTSVNCTCTAPV